MSTVPSEISKYMGSATKLAAIWGSLLYNVKDTGYGAKGDGTTVDTSAIQSAITAAAINGGIVFFPPSTGSYITGSFTVPSNVTLWFANGAKLSIISAATVTINGPINAGYSQIFTGSGTVAGFGRMQEVYSEWWGAVGDGVTNDSAAIQSAFNAASVVRFRPVQYKIGTQVNIPQGKVLNIEGTGLKKTEFLVAAGIVGFKYLRVSGQSGSLVKFTNIILTEIGLGKTSYGIDFQGPSSVEHDNWLRMEDCFLYGFDRGVNLKFCGQCYFTRVFAQANRSVYFLNRDASFIYFQSCMSLSNLTFIYGDDTLADGISNSIFINNCNSVTGTDVDIRIVGWQGVYINNGGCDLGSGGTQAIYIGSCQDVFIDEMYVSTDATATATRYGIWVQNSQTVTIKSCSIVNSKVGILIEGANGTGTKAVIEGNKFDGNNLNDIFIGTYVTSSKIIANHFKSVVSRTGTNYDIYANSVGADFNFITLNTFKGASYTITTGAASITTNNIFGATG